MGNWQINGNLRDETHGLVNYSSFETEICNVKCLYDKCFGVELLNKIDFYVDNATAGSGYTPIATCVLNKIVVIKLGIGPQDRESKIVFQFSHELMHIVFFAVHGIDKIRANDTEESICTAASLITIRILYPKDFDLYCGCVRDSNEEKYIKGIEVANRVSFDLINLLDLVYQ